MFCATCLDDSVAAGLAYADLDGRRLILCRSCREPDPRTDPRRPIERGYSPGPSIGGIATTMRKRQAPPQVRQVAPVTRQRGLGTSIHRVPVMDANGKNRDSLEALRSVDADWVDDARYLGCVTDGDGLLVHVFDSRPLVGRSAGLAHARARLSTMFSEGQNGDSECVLAPDATIATAEDDAAAIAQIVEGRL